MFLVSGATGNVGSELVRVLLDAGHPVGALVRAPDRPLPAGVQRVLGDLNDPAGLVDAMGHVNGLFLMPGYAATAELLEVSAEAGVERVVLMSGGAAGASNVDNAVSRYMLAAEDAVRASALRWTILRPFAFASNAMRWSMPVERHIDAFR